MQALRNLVVQIDALYIEIAATFIDYQYRQQLFCRSGCGKCCTHPNIYASVLEMLPLALHLYDTHQADQFLEQLEAPELQTNCIFYTPTSNDNNQGYCNIYRHRPSLCRMFGAAGYPDKFNQIQLSTCATIKEDNAEALGIALINIDQEPPPLMKDWKSKVSNIDYHLGKQELPLNEAIKEALYHVLTKTQFSNRPINVE